jgi:predicted transcriptional regulator of viral defense system
MNYTQDDLSKLRGLGARERRVFSDLVASEKPTISADDVVERLGIDRTRANLMLSRLSKKGWLQRLKRGVYAPVPISSKTGEPIPEDPFAIANALFAPCYISGWSAAEHWDLTEQISNTVVVFTSRRLRSTEHLVARVKYRTKYISEDLMFGTTKVWFGVVASQVADPHRTVADVLSSPDLGGGGRQTVDIVRAYWKGQHADPDRLLDYAQRLRNGALFKRLGLTAEMFADPTDDWIARCRQGMTKGVALLDPSGPRRGKIVSRWRIRINIPLPREE